jgi:hypothetical protein
MWMVRYAKTATIQGAASVYVPRSSLATEEQCGHRSRWASDSSAEQSSMDASGGSSL